MGFWPRNSSSTTDSQNLNVGEIRDNIAKVMGSYTPVTSQKLKKALEDLILLPGIDITLKGIYDSPVDSRDLIRADMPKQAFEIAMYQLEDKRELAKKNSDCNLEVVAANNLGCIYAWLGKYTLAKQTLMDAAERANPGSTVSKAARYNLSVLGNILDV